MRSDYIAERAVSDLECDLEWREVDDESSRGASKKVAARAPRLVKDVIIACAIDKRGGPSSCPAMALHVRGRGRGGWRNCHITSVCSCCFEHGIFRVPNPLIMVFPKLVPQVCPYPGYQ